MEITKQTIDKHLKLLIELKELCDSGEKFSLTSLHTKHLALSGFTVPLQNNKILEKVGSARKGYTFKWLGINPNVKMVEKTLEEMQKKKSSAEVPKKKTATDDLFGRVNDLVNALSAMPELSRETKVLVVNECLGDRFLEYLKRSES